MRDLIINLLLGLYVRYTASKGEQNEKLNQGCDRADLEEGII